ncbi:hypothetical protein INT80_14500 [Gallibacterium anatis]|uniref:Uncharacterized protein n=1 Tax=Gallibacterium anatis TaxID=750 RepID=A0A930UVR9_9PAST|nr:hypothetical protein [Gallibacterium anatis]
MGLTKSPPLFDKAGNTSLVSDAKDFTIDATVPGDTNGDGKADTNDINGKPSVLSLKIPVVVLPYRI